MMRPAASTPRAQIVAAQNLTACRMICYYSSRLSPRLCGRQSRFPGVLGGSISMNPRDAPAAALELGEHAPVAVKVQSTYGHKGATFLQPGVHALGQADIALIEQPSRNKTIEALQFRAAASHFLAHARHGREITSEISRDHRTYQARHVLVIFH